METARRDILGNTKQKKKDYLSGKILRIADNIGKHSDAIEFLRRHRSIEDMQKYLADIMHETE